MFCPSEKLALLVTSVMNNDLSNQTDSPHGARNNAGAYAICNAGAYAICNAKISEQGRFLLLLL